MSAVRRPGLAERTAVVLVSDHGEAFYEHGRMLHANLCQEVIRVPLIIWAPGRIPTGGRILDVVRGIDVAPTLIELAGVALGTG